MSLIFFSIAAIAISGWGVLALPHSESWSRRFGAGSLLMFFLVSAAGWSGFLQPALLWTILAVGTLLWVRPGRFSMPGGGYMIALCGLILFPLILLPPISRDAMIHHLYQARLWLEAGRIVRPEWSGIFSYPYLVESFYSIAGGTFGFRVSRVVSLLGFLAACSVSAGYFLREGKKKTAILSLIILMSIPELVRNATWSCSKHHICCIQHNPLFSLILKHQSVYFRNYFRLFSCFFTYYQSMNFLNHNSILTARQIALPPLILPSLLALSSSLNLSQSIRPRFLVILEFIICFIYDSMGS